MASARVGQIGKELMVVFQFPCSVFLLVLLLNGFYYDERAHCHPTYEGIMSIHCWVEDLFGTRVATPVTVRVFRQVPDISVNVKTVCTYGVL